MRKALLRLHGCHKLCIKKLPLDLNVCSYAARIEFAEFDRKICAAHLNQQTQALKSVASDFTNLNAIIDAGCLSAV